MAQILVLDDVADSGFMLKKILQKKGHDVYVFSDEDDALRFAGDHAIDLAILDMKLRKMDGTEVLSELKKLHPPLPVIMLTGLPSQSAARLSMRLGATAYCTKPIDKQELEKTVTCALPPAADK